MNIYERQRLLMKEKTIREFLIVVGIIFVILLNLFIIMPIYGKPTKDMGYIADNSLFYVGNGCSGTLIDKEKKLVLTNYHCVYSFHKQLRDKDGKPKKDRGGNVMYEWQDIPLKQEVYEGNGVIAKYDYSSQISYYDESVDLALIRVDSPLRKDAYPVPIYHGEEPKRGDIVITIGNPLRNIGSVGYGVITHPYREITMDGSIYKVMQHDASQAPGSSGGGLYNEEGYLLGITNAGAPGYEIYYAIPYYTVWKFLSER